MPLADSIGLNEQELAAIAAALKGPHLSIWQAPVTIPDTGHVIDTLQWLLLRFDPAQRLSRIHFHSLTYHIAAVRKGTRGTKFFVRTRASVCLCYGSVYAVLDSFFISWF